MMGRGRSDRCRGYKEGTPTARHPLCVASLVAAKLGIKALRGYYDLRGKRYTWRARRAREGRMREEEWLLANVTLA